LKINAYEKGQGRTQRQWGAFDQSATIPGAVSLRIYIRNVATVQNRTEKLPYSGHADTILRKKKQKQIEDATKASVKKEMAQPRMARSARIAGLILGKARLPAIQGRKPPQIRRPASDSV
jgi:hypothetical protein